MPTEKEVFEAAHQHVMRWEGGFFDHPDDPGGVTLYGVSLMFLKDLGLLEGDIDGDGDIDRNDVLSVTRETARKLFKRHFWDKPGVGTMPPLVGVVFYDFAVNAGQGRATRILQQVLGVEDDGIIGPQTRGALASRCQGGQLAVALAFLDAREDWYRRLSEKKSSSAVFLHGWLNRSEDCRRLVKRLSAEWGIA